MEKTTGNHDEFVKLSQTLGPFGAWISPEQAAVFTSRIVAALDDESFHVYQRAELRSALERFCEQLPPEQAAAGATAILRLLAFDFKDGVPRRVAQSLTNLVGAIAPDDTLSILKSPVCVGGVRRAVLSGLEKKTGQTFDGNIWKAVRWADSQRIDVAAVPQCPLRSDSAN